MDASAPEPGVTPPPLPHTGKSWVERHRVWIIVVSLLALLGLGSLFLRNIFAPITTSDVYEKTLARVRADPRALEALGSPIHEGNYNVSAITAGGITHAEDVGFDVYGPKGKATVEASVKFYGGDEWTFQKLRLIMDGGKKEIDLLKPPPPKETMPKSTP
jgi:hypothetical protein